MNKSEKHKRIHLALQLYDTSDPPLSIRQCTKLAGLKHPALLFALRRREKRNPYICPTCGLAPGDKISLDRVIQEKEKTT